MINYIKKVTEVFIIQSIFTLKYPKALPAHN